MQPIEKIVEWAKDKPVFWRHAVKLALTKGELTEKQYNLIWIIAQMEYGVIAKGDVYPLYETPVTASGLITEVSEINLSSITDVINVGSLASNQNLNLSPTGLNIVYGDNGTGKSTYARILKHACLTRGDVAPVLGNVFLNSSEEPSAKLTVCDDKDSLVVDWTKTAEADENLKSIRVFDTETASHYVSKKEGALGYKPFVLKILDSLSRTLDYVKRQIEEETMPGNGIQQLPIISVDSEAGKYIADLSYQTSVEDVETHVATDDELGQIKPLQQRIYELKSRTASTIRKELKLKCSRVIPLLKKLQELNTTLSENAFSDLKSLKDDAVSKAELAKALQNKVLSNLPFNGVGDSKWQSLWDAASSFAQSQIQSTEFPPQESENCPLCLQEVDKSSAIKLAGFKAYVADETVKNSDKAIKKYKLAKKTIEDLAIDVTDYDPVIEELTTNENEFTQKVSNFVKALTNRRNCFLKDDFSEPLISIDNKVIVYCENLITELTNDVNKLVDDEAHANLIKEKEQLLLELKARKVVRDNKVSILKNITRYIFENRLQHILGETNTRKVTTLSNELSKAILIEPLVKCFKEELDKFGFDRFDVEVKTRGSSVEQLAKLAIVQGSKNVVAEVASEGEQRCIAIACFLAEILSDGRKSAVIFDDPVNSLDHRWREDIGKRLVEESLERQVIIFTHDIVFYKYLLECVDKTAGSAVTQVRLDRNRKHTGLVDNTPPWDALPIKTRIGQLKNSFQALDKVDRTGTELEYCQLCYSFYNMLRESWERLVEEKLFNNVVTRFGRSIQTQRITKLVGDIIQSDYDSIELGMSNCSTFFQGHDTATGLQQRPRKIIEVKADLDLIGNLLIDLNKRR
jgi:energy-coupling factor transporter ATP-binding protein EcfA2